MREVLYTVGRERLNVMQLLDELIELGICRKRLAEDVKSEVAKVALEKMVKYAANRSWWTNMNREVAVRNLLIESGALEAILSVEV